MTVKATLTDLRNGIEEAYREVIREQGNGEAPNELVLKKVRSSLGAELIELNSNLVEIALIKLLNDVSNRKGAKAINGAGLDLFGQYRGIPKHIAVGPRKKKATAMITFVEADLWLKAHSMKASIDRNEEFRRLVEECRPFRQSDHDTLQMAMDRKKLSEK